MKKRGFLGVHLIRLTKELRAHFGVPEDAGVMVAKVERDSPAEKAGVKVGDVLIEVDSQKVKSAWGIQRLIGKKKEGEKTSLKVVRSKKVKRLTASIVERKRPLVEVSRFLQWVPEEEGEPEVEVVFDSEFLDETMRNVQEHLQDLDIDKKVLKFHKIEGDIEERLEKMEEKLKELEKKLQGRIPKKSRHTTL